MLVLPISRSTSLIWNYQFYNEYLLTVTIYTTPSEILVLSRNTFMISAFHFNRTFFLCLEQQFTVNKHKETKINDLKTAKAIDYIFCIVIDFFCIFVLLYFLLLHGHFFGNLHMEIYFPIRAWHKDRAWVAMYSGNPNLTHDWPDDITVVGVTLGQTDYFVLDFY